jgi:hypothetical protein
MSVNDGCADVEDYAICQTPIVTMSPHAMNNTHPHKIVKPYPIILNKPIYIMQRGKTLTRPEMQIEHGKALSRPGMLTMGWGGMY